MQLFEITLVVVDDEGLREVRLPEFVVSAETASGAEQKARQIAAQMRTYVSVFVRPI